MAPSDISAPSASDTSRQIEQRIRTEIRNIGIPPRPAILARIESEMRKPEPDYRLLSDAISSDVGLAASVMKVANSPFFGFARKVRSVPEALLVLGLKTTLHTVAGIAFLRIFPHIPSLERFWDATAKTARVSGWLALRWRGQLVIRPDDAFTFGLFRDCGIPLMMIPFPDYANTLKHANQETQRVFTAIEDDIYTLNHAMVGAELAEDWRLPEEVAEAIRYHHDPVALAGSQATVPLFGRQLIAVSQIAETLIQRITGQNLTNEWSKLGAQSLQLLGITEDELVSLEGETAKVIHADF